MNKLRVINAEDIKTYDDLCLFIRGMRDNIATHYVSCVVIKDLDYIRELVNNHKIFIDRKFASKAFELIKDSGSVCGVKYRIDKNTDPWILLECKEYKSIIDAHTEESSDKIKLSLAIEAPKDNNIFDGYTDEELLEQSVLSGHCFDDLVSIRDE